MFLVCLVRGVCAWLLVVACIVWCWKDGVVVIKVGGQAHICMRESERRLDTLTSVSPL